jgi:hypothetical protein
MRLFSVVAPVPPLAIESCAPDQLLLLIVERVASEPRLKLLRAVLAFVNSDKLLAGFKGVKPRVFRTACCRNIKGVYCA